ncbi:hypothetical protein ACWDU3_14290 [Streptomyces olivaceus]
MTDVNALGDDLVRLGAVSPEAAELLAELVTAGLPAELTGTTDTAPSTDLRETPAA